MAIFLDFLILPFWLRVIDYVCSVCFFFRVFLSFSFSRVCAKYVTHLYEQLVLPPSGPIPSVSCSLSFSSPRTQSLFPFQIVFILVWYFLRFILENTDAFMYRFSIKAKPWQTNDNKINEKTFFHSYVTCVFVARALRAVFFLAVAPAFRSLSPLPRIFRPAVLSIVSFDGFAFGDVPKKLKFLKWFVAVVFTHAST